MTESDARKLCIDLAHADSEREVIDVLGKLWDDDSAWKEMDESSGNWSTIGNQQSAPDTALVEKLINSVDAVMIDQCLRSGIKPDSEEAPKNIAEAQKKYFGISGGKLSSIDASARARIAENVMLVATGGKRSGVNPSYSIIDSGEGQSPSAFANTFLSLNRGNKSRVHFVQGKFGMGGTGVFRFGSPEHNLQLVISKKDPAISTSFKKDDSDYWGFTIIRRKSPSGQMRSSIFTYLAPDGKVPAFKADSLPLLPGEYPDMYSKPMKHGSFIKIYEYELTGLKTNVKFDLYYRLSLLMPNIALPITLYERRPGYRGESHHIVLSGLSVRLDEDKRENLEEGFPSSGELRVRGESMDFLIYAFRKGQREKYARNEGIIFSVNGQAHGFIPKSFFDRKAVKMSYLSDSILVIVDCSKINRRMQEDLFMNSRDRLGGGPIQDEIETKLEEIISNHPGLRALRDSRRREEIENKLQDSKPLADVIENIIKQSPTLSKLFIQGVRIKNPFGLVESKTKGEFKPKRFPTYFKLSKEYLASSPKRCPSNRKFRIQFETDAGNDYFNRDREPGEFILTAGGAPVKDFSVNLWNGLASLNAELPDGVNVGDKLVFETKVMDNSRVDPFSNEFHVLVGEPEEKKPSKPGQRKPNSDGDDDTDMRQQPSYLDLPNMVELRKADGERWSSHFADDADALSVRDAGEGGFDFYLNMDNVYLLTEAKGNTKMDPKLLEARYKYGMVLIGVSLLEYFEHKNKQKEEVREKDGPSVADKIFHFSKAISPVLLPMIASLGDLELEV